MTSWSWKNSWQLQQQQAVIVQKLEELHQQLPTKQMHVTRPLLRSPFRLRRQLALLIIKHMALHQQAAAQRRSMQRKGQQLVARQLQQQPLSQLLPRQLLLHLPLSLASPLPQLRHLQVVLVQLTQVLMPSHRASLLEQHTALPSLHSRQQHSQHRPSHSSLAPLQLPQLLQQLLHSPSIAPGIRQPDSRQVPRNQLQSAKLLKPPRLVFQRPRLLIKSMQYLLGVDCTLCQGSPNIPAAEAVLVGQGCRTGLLLAVRRLGAPGLVPVNRPVPRSGLANRS